MRHQLGKTSIFLGLLLITVWVVQAASSPPPTRAGSYAFGWAPDVWGYGGYVAALADLDGDGAEELVVQGVAGEYEGQEPGPQRVTAIYAHVGSSEIVERARSLNVGEVVAAADLDGDGRAELVARDGSGSVTAAWRLNAEEVGITAVSGELLERYRDRGGVLPGDAGPALDRWPRDLDGDGLLDGVARAEGEDGVELVLQTAAGERRIPIEPGGDEARPAGPAVGRGAETTDPRPWVDVKVEAWLPSGEAGWPVLAVGEQWEGSRAVELSVWQPTETGYQTVWTARLVGGSGPYDLPPAWAFLDLDGDATPELVQGKGGVIEVLAWTGSGFDKLIARTPENGGLGWAGFHAADLNGNGLPELVARHVSPNLYTHNLKLYELRDQRLVGLADLNGIGSSSSAPGLAWRREGAEVLLLQREFERARPEALRLGDGSASPGRSAE